MSDPATPGATAADPADETAGVESSSGRLGRRGLIAGAGVTALVGATLAGVPAYAEPVTPRRNTIVGADGSPITSTLASPRQNGYVYRNFGQFDFVPENLAANRVFGGYGVYTVTTPSPLWTSCDIPAGAVIRDIEWYAFNNSGSPATAYARLWGAGSASLTSVVVDTTIGTNTDVTAYRSVVPDATAGPFPTATKLYLGIYASNSSLQLNGVRVGLSGGGHLSLLAAPVRVYDSRSTGGKFGESETRTITVPNTAGAVGVLANITAVSGTANGYVTAYPAYAPLPTASSLNFSSSGAAIANAITVGVSTSGQLKIFARKPVHVIVDVSGFVG